MFRPLLLKKGTSSSTRRIARGISRGLFNSVPKFQPATQLARPISSASSPRNEPALASTPLELKRSVASSHTSTQIQAAAPLNELRAAYESKIPLSERRLLEELLLEWRKSSPFRGNKIKKVLINCHLTTVTLTLAHILQEAGVEVAMTAKPPLVVHREILPTLEKAGIPFYADGDIPLELRDQFDAVIDCGNGMKDVVRPKVGGVELTFVPESEFDGIDYPVISVNKESSTKKLETMGGTGVAVVDTIKIIAEKAFYAAIQNILLHENGHSYTVRASLFGLISSFRPDNIFTSNQYIIFGHGNVGGGIAFALKKAGVPEDNIVIVETSFAAYVQSTEAGYKKSIFLNSSEPEEYKAAVEDLIASLQHTQVCITATGIKGALSNIPGLDFEHFNHIKLFLNAGTHNEYGPKFPKEVIFFDGQPCNFNPEQEFPTRVKFLDPVFRLLLEALAVLGASSWSKGLHPIPKKLDERILKAFIKLHGKEIFTSQREFSAKIRELISSSLSDHSKDQPPLDKKSTSRPAPQSATTDNQYRPTTPTITPSSKFSTYFHSSSPRAQAAHRQSSSYSPAPSLAATVIPPYNSGGRKSR